MITSHKIERMSHLKETWINFYNEHNVTIYYEWNNIVIQDLFPSPLIFKYDKYHPHFKLFTNYLLQNELCTKINETTYMLTSKLLSELPISDLQELINILDTKINKYKLELIQRL